ncbi:hypothetical protein ElyMa_002191100 [Elysia marginata]|uniref:Uncharacterized protein n=1 Tax=Elysia marginata TaxID=1093978 RepID=A0AAV4FQ26_9GAST|nr:hypothetical protein ElyMa_002191100 [Elysia marginata]
MDRPCAQLMLAQQYQFNQYPWDSVNAGAPWPPGEGHCHLLQHPKSSILAVSREDLEAHLKKTYSDPNRENPLEDTASLVCSAAYEKKFNNKTPNVQETAVVL